MEWVVKRVDSILHYLDDFLFVGPWDLRVCSLLLQAMECVPVEFGIPLVPDEMESPTTELKFLVIVIDSE